jgi:membrane dipeptidase
MPFDVADTGRLRDALAVLDVATTVDLHTDTFIAARLGLYDPAKEHRPRHRAFVGHVDLPRARRGGLKGALWSITTNPFRSAAGRARALRENLDRLRAWATSTPGAAFVTTAAAFDAAMARGDHAVIPTIQGANALGDAVSLRAVDVADVVSVTLVHLLSSGYGETSTPLPLRRWLGPAGLSGRGRALIEQLDQERVLLDLAHASVDTFWDAVSVHDRALPLAVTHTGVNGVFPHWRNIDDAQLKAVADTDGIVGVIFQPSFLGPKDSHDDGVALVMRHLAHIVAVVGEDHAALGSDWDGFIVPSADLRDPLALPGLVVEMQARGWREERIKKILGGNFRRVLGALRPG